jgi:negative regulator of flagellin synthesis FlgM
MTIDRIGSINPIQSDNKPGRVNQPAKAGNADSISLSPEAIAKSDFFHTVKVVSAVPDVRIDFVADLKKRMGDPNYLNDTVLNGIAEGIMDQSDLMERFDL